MKEAEHQNRMTVICDKDMIIREIISPRYYTLLQHHKDDLIGINILDLEKHTVDACKPQAAIVSNNIRKAIEERTNVYFEYSVVRDDNVKLYALCFAGPGPDEKYYINAVEMEGATIHGARNRFTDELVTLLFNNIASAVWLRYYARNGSSRYITFNDNARILMYGTLTDSMESILNSKLWSQQSDDENDAIALQSDEYYKYEKVFKNVNGNFDRIFEISKKRVQGVMPGYYIVTTVVEVTRFRNDEMLLEKQGALLNSIYSTLPIGVLQLSLKGDITFANEKMNSVLGRDGVEKLMQRNFFTDFHQIPFAQKENIRKGQTVDFETYFEQECEDASKRIMDVQIIGSPVKDKSGNIENYLLLLRDITRKKNLERRIERDAQFNNAFNLAIPFGIIVYNSQGDPVEVNDSAGQLYRNVSKREGPYKNFFDVEDIPEHIKEEVRAGNSVNFTLVRGDDLERRYLELRSVVVRNKEGQIGGFVVSLHDSTEIISRNRQLEETNDNLDMALSAGRMNVWCYNVLEKGFRVVRGESFISPIISYDDMLSVLDEDCIEHFKESLQNVIDRKDKTGSAFVSLSNRTGKNVHIMMSFRGIIEDGKVVKVWGVADDLTSLYEQRLAFEKNREELNLALEAGKISAWTYNIERNQYFTLYGETVSGGGISVNDNLLLLHPDDVSRQQAVFEDLMSGKIDKSHGVFRYRLHRDDTDYRYLESFVITKKRDGKVFLLLGTQQDITEDYLRRRKIDEFVLKTQIINELCDMVQWDYDIDKHIVSAYYGRSLMPNSDMTVETFLTLIHPDDVPKVKDVTRQVDRREIDVINVEVRFRLSVCEDYSMCAVSGIAIKDENDEVIRYSGIRRDISHWLDLNAKLKEQSALNKIILDNINCKVLFFSNDCTVQWSNYKATPLQQEQMSVYLDDKGCCRHRNESGCCDQTIECILRNSRNSGCINNEEITFDNGSIVKVSTIPVLDDDMTHIGTIIEMDDVTEQRRMIHNINEEKERAEHANQLLNEIVERLPGAIYFKDVYDDYRYILANDMYCKNLGVKREDIIGKTDYEIYSKETADLYRKYDQRLLAGENRVSYNSSFETTGNGTMKWQISKSLIEVGRTKFIVGIATDVTYLHQINTELQEMRKKAEQSDKLKSAFLANMSHELRTPLNAIVGFSELMSETDDPEDKAQYYKIIANNNEVLLRLIGDILDLSKIEAGMIDLKREVFDMARYFNELSESFRSRITNPDVELVVENPYRSCEVFYDKGRFTQVVNNFVSNAIKYTKKGYIKVGYVVENGGIKVYVSDTGIGIAENKKDKVFQRFEKLDEFAQGSGLGLSIVKALAESYGGQVGFQSEEGVGSTFWSWTPSSTINIIGNDAEFVPTLPKKPIDASNRFGTVKKILVAEDNDSNFLILKYILSDFEIARACTGREAIQMASVAGYDVILMDIKMPDIDGIEATIQIRTFDRTIPIIAVTANAFVSDKEEALKAGCNYFVAKPIKRAELFAVLEEIGNEQVIN